MNIISGFEEKGIGFESITKKIEATSAAVKLVFRVFVALAEFERVAALGDVSRSWMRDE